MYKAVTFAAILLTLSFLAVRGEEPFWEIAMTPPNADVMTIAINQDNDIFCGTKNGMFKSSDYGYSWDWVMDGYVHEIINGNNDVIYVQRRNSETYDFSDTILCSIDRGNSWQKFSKFWNDTLSPVYIFSDKQHLLLVLGNGKSFDLRNEYYYSPDEGSTWEKIWEIGGNGYFMDHFPQKPGIIDSTIIVPIIIGNYTNMALTRDLGKTWEKQDVNAKVYKVQIISNNEIYLLTNNGIYLSGDTGKTWSQKWLKGKFIASLLVLDENTIFAGYGNRIYYSTDRGTTWQEFGGLNELNNGSIGGGLSISCIKADNKKNLYCSPRPYGIYKSVDNGKTWVEKNNGLSAISYNKDIGFYNSDIYISCWGLFKSGTSWKEWIYSGLKTCYLAHMAINSKGDIFVGDRNTGDTEKGIFRSTDKGETWQNFREGSLGIRSILINSKDILFSSIGAGYILRSTDNAENWEELDAGGSYLAINDEKHIFCFGAGKIFRSTDDGLTWEKLLDVWPDPTLNDEGGRFVFNKKTKTAWYFIGYQPVIGKNGIYKTTDNGRTWFKDNKLYLSNYTDNINFYNLAVDSTYAWLTTGTNGVYRSTDNGDSWYRLDTTGLKHRGLRKISVSPDGHIFVFGSTGCLYRSRDRFVSVKDKKTEPNEMTLTNSPNPFSDKTEISYSLTEPGYVSISIIDILGREVFKHTNEFEESGRHSITFSSEGLSSGVYYCVIESGGRTITRPVMIIR